MCLMHQAVYVVGFWKIWSERRSRIFATGPRRGIPGHVPWSSGMVGKACGDPADRLACAAFLGLGFPTRARGPQLRDRPPDPHGGTGGPGGRRFRPQPEPLERERPPPGPAQPLRARGGHVCIGVQTQPLHPQATTLVLARGSTRVRLLPGRGPQQPRVRPTTADGWVGGHTPEQTHRRPNQRCVHAWARVRTHPHSRPSPPASTCSPPTRSRPCPAPRRPLAPAPPTSASRTRQAPGGQLLPPPRAGGRGPGASGSLLGQVPPTRTFSPPRHPSAGGQIDSKPPGRLGWPWVGGAVGVSRGQCNTGPPAVGLHCHRLSVFRFWWPEVHHPPLRVEVDMWAEPAPPKLLGDTRSPGLPSSGRVLLAVLGSLPSPTVKGTSLHVSHCTSGTRPPSLLRPVTLCPA